MYACTLVLHVSAQVYRSMGMSWRYEYIICILFSSNSSNS